MLFQALGAFQLSQMKGLIDLQYIYCVFLEFGYCIT